MERILFFSVSIGSGHDLAAQAAAEEIINRYPGCQWMIVDTFKYINPILNKVIAGSYMESLKFNPKIWGYLYEHAEQDKKMFDMGQIFSNLLSVKLDKLIESFAPQAIICTHAFPTGILSALKSKGKLKVPLASIITDFTVHPFWVHPHVDVYVLAAAELVDELLARGVRKEQVIPCGIPIRSQFRERYDMTETRNKLGLEDKTSVLVMGGGLGLGEIETIIRTLGNADLDLQVVTITGKNDRLWAKLQYIKSKNNIKIYGFVDNMAEIMAAADFIVTKPGGLTTAEVLSQKLPMLIVDPLPGQEDRNTDFLLNNGVAVKIRNTSQLVPQLRHLMERQIRVDQMKQMCAVIGKPNAASEFIDYMETLIKD